MPFRGLHSVATLRIELSHVLPKRYSPTRVPPVLHLTLHTGGRACSIAGVDAEFSEPNEPYWHWLSRVCQLLDLWRLLDPGGSENLAVLLATV